MARIKANKTEPITVRLSLEAARILDFYAVTCFEGSRAKTIEHCVRYAAAGLDAPKPARQRNGKMPKP